MAELSPIEKADNWFVGEDKTLRFTVTGQDITGWAVEFVLRKARSAVGNPVLQKTTAANEGITLSSPATGVLDVVIERDDTKDLNPGVYYYTLRRTDANFSTVLAHGPAEIQQGATR